MPERQAMPERHAMPERQAGPGWQSGPGSAGTGYGDAAAPAYSRWW